MRDGGLRALFRHHMPLVHWESIESPFTNKGIPDLNGCYKGQEFWVECKKTSGYTVGLEPEQVAWALRRHRAGGRTFIAVRRQCKAGPRRGVEVDELWIIPGRYARELKVNGLNRKEPPGWMWGGGPNQWCWVSISAIFELGLCLDSNESYHVFTLPSA